MNEAGYLGYLHLRFKMCSPVSMSEACMLFDQMIMFNDAHDGVLGESPNLKNSFTPGGNVYQSPPEGALIGAAIQVVLTPITPYAAQAIIVKNVLTLDKET